MADSTSGTSTTPNDTATRKNKHKTQQSRNQYSGPSTSSHANVGGQAGGLNPPATNSGTGSASSSSSHHGSELTGGSRSPEPDTEHSATPSKPGTSSSSDNSGTGSANNAASPDNTGMQDNKSDTQH